jgi:hypothetical protein
MRMKRLTGFLVLVWGISVVCGAGEIIAADRPPRLRARPPGLPWDRLVSDAFFEDAFATLEGPRPDLSQRRSREGVPQARPPAAEASESESRWSQLASPETLLDEIKDRASELEATVATPAVFKGGGYRECRVHFTTIATMFGVISEYGEDVRWHDEAAAARDLFARAGFNCKAGSDQTFNEAKARTEDITSMIQGSRLQRQSAGGGGVLWSDVAARSPLMVRLEMAEKKLSEYTSSAAAFRSDSDAVLHESEIVALLARVLVEPEFDDFDDETYREYATEMETAANEMRTAVLESRYDQAAASLGRLKKSCDTCHGDYR